jgi:hypothetical protein
MLYMATSPIPKRLTPPGLAIEARLPVVGWYVKLV